MGAEAFSASVETPRAAIAPTLPCRRALLISDPLTTTRPAAEGNAFSACIGEGAGERLANLMANTGRFSGCFSAQDSPFSTILWPLKDVQRPKGTCREGRGLSRLGCRRE